MWKKLLISLIALFGTFSVVFTFEKELSAQNSNAVLVTGRIGKAEQGDRYYVGSEYSGVDVDIQLIKKQGDNSWFSMNATSFGNITYGASYLMSESNLYKHVIPLNATIKTNARSLEIFKTHPSDSATASRTQEEESKDYKSVMDKGGMEYFFIPTENEIGLTSHLNISGAGADPYGLGFQSSYFAYNEFYFGPWIWHSKEPGGTGKAATAITSDGSYQSIWGMTDYFPMRFSALIDLEEQVFALGKDVSDNTLIEIEEPSYNNGSAMYTAKGSPMQTRIKNTKTPVTITFDKITLENKTKEITKVGNAEKIQIHYSNATAGNHKISLLIKENNKYKYYFVLGNVNASGSGYFDFDASTLPNGTYEIALVNEEISSTLSPVYASDITSSKSIEIVEGHSITYTKAPQAGASLGDYEYDKNVDEGQKIGTITYNGKGVAPISYELTSFNGTDTSYENFEIAGLSAGTSSANTLDVKIKTNAKDLVSTTKSLKAGAYKFCIVSKDANEAPITDNDKTKVCVELEVKKTQPTIAFKTLDKDKELITGSTTQSIQSIQHATHNNEDIIANGGNDFKIVYTQKSGTSGLFTGLPITMNAGGEITISTVANKDGEIVLNAHIDATDNYLAADTTKTIKVVLGLDATYVEDKTNIKAGSSEAKPSTTVPIGHISVSGGTSPFTYAFKTGENQNGNFKLDTSTGKIYVDASVGSSGLTPGEYTIEVEVTDSTSPTKQKKTVTKKITIQEADLAGVAFEDPDTAGKKADSTITRTYDPANDGGTFRTKLFETTIGSLTGTTITYSVDPASNAVLEYTKTEGGYAYFKVKKGSSSSEKGTILIKANVKGGAYGSTGKDITIPVNVDPYTQEIEFTQTKPYSLANTASCTSIPATKKSTYWNQDDTTNKITYTSSDTNKVTIDENGNVCPVKDATGTITLTATLAGDDSYKEAKSTITINLIPELEGAYIEDKQNIVAGSKEAKPSTTTKIGHFTATGGTSGYTYAKKAGDNDNDQFDIKANGDVFVSTGAGANGLLPGDYTIEVEITDSTTPTAQTTTFKKTITIKPATLSVKFEDPDDSSKTIENVITRTYDPSTTPVGGSFHTRLVEIEKDALTGAKIAYSVEADPNDVLEYVDMSGDYANFKVKKASDASEKNQIKIKATVSGGYYGDKGEDVTILVNVEQYKQEIEFKQTNPYPLPNTSQCTSIPATKKSTYWNQSASNEIKYTSSDTSKATIDADGKVCPVAGATGTINLKAELAGDDNYSDAEATIKINLLGELTLTYAEDTPSKQAVNPDKTGDTGNAKDGAEFGSITVAGGLDKRYDIQIKNDDYANAYFDCVANPSNQRASTLKLKSGVSITAAMLKVGMDAGVIVQDSANKDQYNWTMQVLPNTGEEPQEIIVHILGADPILTFEKEVNNEITATYQKNGTIDLSVKRGNTVLSSGISIEGTTGYQTFIDSLANLTTDAQVNGISIKKANCDNDDNVIAGKSIKVTPKAEAGDGYKSGTGSATPVIIKKAEHPDVDFIDPDTILQSGIASVDKGFTGIEDDDAHLTITPKDPSTWEGTTFEKLDSGDASEPSVTIKPNGYEGAVVYIVHGGGTDNYKPIVNKEIDLFFSSTGGITYKPIKITYGDDTKKVIDYITDGDKETNSYAYAPVEGNSYLDEDNKEILTLDNTTSTITTIQVGKTKVNVTRESADGSILTQAIPVEVVPKEITLTYASNTIYAGEILPTPSFIEPADGVLVGNDTIADFPIPASAAHYKGNEVITDSKTTGTYDTKGNWTSDELEFDVNSNYKVTIKAGKLTIKKDSAKDSWYHLEDPEGNTVSKNDWHNYYVNVVLDTATGTAGTYDQIANSEAFTNADKTKFTVTNEDENSEDVYFRIDPNGSSEHKGAITNTQTTIKIDMTDPLITSITGYPVNTDGLSELINNLTFGMFYKPGVEVMIQTSDPQPSGESGRAVSGVHTVSYKIYKLGEKGEFDSTQTPQTDEGTIDANGRMSFKINKVGNYRVCAIAKDNASNQSKESCSDLNIKQIDEDVDGDEIPDFNDSDTDGCPDLNIILGEDKDGNKVKLNVAEKGKKYPYMNIDSNGDGLPDLNIDTDHDGKPDLNLVTLTEKDWSAKTCVVVEKLKDYSKPIEYCTGTDAKPVINVDTDDNGVPDINIDTDGDFIADFNIDINGNGEPDVNIGKVHTNWKPDKDFTYEGFVYDTMVQDKPIVNVDSDSDGRPDLNIDLDGDGEPDINIDADGNGIPETNIDSTGDGKPDINVDTNGDGKANEHITVITEWIPSKNVDGSIKYDTMEIKRKSELEDNGVIVEKPDGTFLPNSAIKVNDISDRVDEDIKDKLNELAGEQEVKRVYDVEYLEDNITKQPDGNVKVKIPVDPLVKNARIVVEKEDGSFEEISYVEKDGYYVFETEYIGKVSVLGDGEDEPEPNTTPEPTPSNPSTNVQGSYTNQANTSGVGGAYTGDSTRIELLLMAMLVSFAFFLLYACKKREKL